MFQEVNSLAACRAGLYIRLSKEDESEGPSQSVKNQQAMLEKFAQEQELQVYDIYIDDGWSGTSFDRPAFQRMLADIEAKRIDLVITKDLSRLGRDYIMTGHYMERYFPEHRVRYISLLDGIDTGVESSANDITPFRAIMNDMYAKDISRKIKSVKRDKQRRGQFIGGKPVYGYKMHPTEKNKIVIDEAAAPVVRRIFSMALNGVSCRKIAAALNEEGIPSPAVYCGRNTACSGLWSSERISDMLQNETYIGSMVQGRQIKISYKSKKCLHQSRENWIVVENTHEPLVDAESFHKVRMLVDSRKHTRSRTYDFPLKGLIFCRECGHPLAVLNRPNAKGEDVLYLVCRSYQRTARRHICTPHCIRETAVMDAVLSRIQALFRSWPPDSHLLFPIAELAAAKSAQAEAADSAALKSRLAVLNKAFDRMYADRLSGLLPEADYLRLFTRLNTERRQTEAQLKIQEPQKSLPIAQTGKAEELVRSFIDSIPGNREILVSLIERIELTDSREIRIFFRCAPPSSAPHLQ